MSIRKLMFNLALNDQAFWLRNKSVRNINRKINNKTNQTFKIAKNLIRLKIVNTTRSRR